ncbi:biotin/lipoyl-binding protein, partial [uncultured Ruegeria sp.]|uniref:biotin/lipoyl-binding protein n=1 Tax=uncultured Ruegeria sp. TaxID=259304 RepID=UPI002630824A
MYVSNNDIVKAGNAIFRLDTTRQEAASETAQRRTEEIEAALGLTATEVAGGAARIRATEADLAQADLPPEAPSFITRVCGSGLHIRRRWF